MRWFINLLILLKYRKTIEKCRKLWDDPQSKYSQRMTEKLTTEEMEGVTDMERVGRILSVKPKLLQKDLSELKNSLDGR